MFPKFDSFEDALNACQLANSVDGYSSSEIVKVVIEKNIIFKENLSTAPIFDLGAARTLIGLGLVNTGGSLNIIDFGGGGGNHYSISKTSLGSQFNCNWAIVETAAMVKEAEEKKIPAEKLKFYNHLSAAKDWLGEVDLIFASSSLQYCPNPFNSLKEIIDINAKYIYITRTPFLIFENKIITIQVSKLSDNGPGPLPSGFQDKHILYPITFISLIDVENLLLEKYEIRFLMNEDKAIHQFDKINIDYFGFFCVRKN